jgi:hypothetical protein
MRRWSIYRRLSLMAALACCAGATLPTAAAIGTASLPVAAGRAALGDIAAAIAAPSREQGATILAPSPKHGATIAGIVSAVTARSRPGAGRTVWRVATVTRWSREPQVLLVLGSAERAGSVWLRVLLPIRPDGTSGWIPRSDALLLFARYWITVDEHARMLTIYSEGRHLHSFRVVIGKPATPTPVGLAAIYEEDPQPDPGGFLGPWALPLTILSNVLHEFEGGQGRIAIHGRGGASLLDPLGSAASHGCIRIQNSAINWMAAHIPQGTPVQITG